MITIVVATDICGCIGRNGEMPWGRSMKDDLKYFRELTMNNTVIMGRKTFESLGNKPLSKRRNIIVSSSLRGETAEGYELAHSIEEALNLCNRDAFIIGGSSIYEQTLPLANIVYLTLIGHSFEECDSFFPELDPKEWEKTVIQEHVADESNPYPYTFLCFNRINHEDNRDSQ